MGPAKRQLPLIEKIKKQEDFPVWRDKLIRVLQRHGLDRYILTEIPRPGDNGVELKQWLDDRADVDDYLQAVVGDIKVWNNLRGMGWKATDLDPKKTFDYLVQYFEGGSVDGSVLLLQEFATIHREAFSSMEAYQSRVNYLRERLQVDGSAFKMPDDGYTWLALRGVLREYPDLYNRCVLSIQSKGLTWAALMAEFQRVAVTENAQPALFKIDKSKAEDKDSLQRNNNNRPDGPVKTCMTCNSTTPEDYVHCDKCAHHRKYNTEVCWWCEPDKAPAGWRNKKRAKQYLKARQSSSTTAATTTTINTATTAPLHQQSGVSNPSTSKPDKPKSVLFSTNLTNLPASDFSKGPWRRC